MMVLICGDVVISISITQPQPPYIITTPWLCSLFTFLRLCGHCNSLKIISLLQGLPSFIRPKINSMAHNSWNIYRLEFEPHLQHSIFPAEQNHICSMCAWGQHYTLSQLSKQNPPCGYSYANRSFAQPVSFREVTLLHCQKKL